MLGVSAPHFSPPGHLVPKSGFPKSLLQRKQGAALRNFKGTSNFSSMRSCKILPPSEGLLGEQRRQLITAGPRLVSQQSQLEGWGKGADSWSSKKIPWFLNFFQPHFQKLPNGDVRFYLT